jgi:phosphonate dehydrogenase
MLPKVVVTNWVHPEVLEALAPHCRVEANEGREPWPGHELLARCTDASAMMAFMPDRVDEAFLAACPDLGIVACALKGFDNFDVAACTRRGVWVTVVPDLLTEPTAELAVGHLIALGRNMPAGDRAVRDGFAGWRPTLYGAGLDGSVVGILGAGRVGCAIAARLQGFGCAAILYTDVEALAPERESALGVRRADFAELLGASDFLVIAAPLTRATRHLVDADALGRMKPGCRLVNISRGSVVDERAVAAALEAGTLAGYAADVFELEDWALGDRPADIPAGLLEERDKTFFTPHLGSAVDRIRVAISLRAAHAILQYLRGERPDGAINEPALG